MTEKLTQTQSFVVTDVERTAIAQKARSMGDASDSAALRAIIREWLELTNSTAPSPSPVSTVTENQ